MNQTRPRVIPILLLKERGLYKTQQFKHPTYVGDPINTMRIFNEKEVDEIIVLDISGHSPDFSYIEDLVSESFMPLSYGGGIATLEQAQRLFRLGIEKIILNKHACLNPELIGQIAQFSGSQSVVVSIDTKKSWLSGERCYVHNGKQKTSWDPVKLAQYVVAHGAGEIMITSITQEGTRQGYDLELTARVASAVNVPVIAHGGAASVADLRAALTEGKASAAAAGSMFVHQGPHRAVLISYPSPEAIKHLLAQDAKAA
ncbi:MAG: AglZ/HisF2 family acetamidino modification protein [Rickettsiales bacterium]|nr:AglZ/HisF2 family acetamidino modification protein [Rickettsiales bacterium]